MQGSPAAPRERLRGSLRCAMVSRDLAAGWAPAGPDRGAEGVLSLPCVACERGAVSADSAADEGEVRGFEARGQPLACAPGRAAESGT